MRIAHRDPHPHPDIREHFFVIQTVSKSNCLAWRKPDMREERFNTKRFGTAFRKNIHTILMPAYKRESGNLFSVLLFMRIWRKQQRLINIFRIGEVHIVIGGIKLQLLKGPIQIRMLLMGRKARRTALKHDGMVVLGRDLLQLIECFWRDGAIINGFSLIDDICAIATDIRVDAALLGKLVKIIMSSACC